MASPKAMFLNRMYRDLIDKSFLAAIFKRKGEIKTYDQLGTYIKEICKPAQFIFKKVHDHELALLSASDYKYVFHGDGNVKRKVVGLLKAHLRKAAKHGKN